MAAVLPAPQEKHSRFTPDPLRSPTAQRYYIEDPEISIKSSMPLPSDLSPSTESLSPFSSPPSPTFSLPPSIEDEHDDDEEETVFPSYDLGKLDQKGPKVQECEEILSDTSPEPSTDSTQSSWTVRSAAADDSSIEYEPSRHVDYLAHEWRDEDIWASWRYVTKHRDTYSNGVRLENASWRTWMKMKLGLGTISPDTLNWLKDCDVTWLYGPLMTSRNLSPGVSPPPSRLGTPNVCQDPKPILKKKTASETILQRSLSQHTLLQHAGAILKAKEEGNFQGQSGSSTSAFGYLRDQSGSPTPTVTAGTPTTVSLSDVTSPNERRHIHFNDEVVQCIAVDSRDEYEDHSGWVTASNIDLSSDDMDMTGNTSPSSLSTSRSLCHEKKTIAPLPSTTLKCRPEPPEPPANTLMQRWFGTHSSPWSSFAQPKQSQPQPEPSANFLMGYDGYDDANDGFDASWQPSQFVGRREDEMDLDQDLDHDLDHDTSLNSSSMLSSPGDYGETSNAGVFDRVLDTVNTAKDIAHVIWNVGWRQ